MPTQPARLTFLRLILAATGLLAWLAAWDAFSLAQKLGIAPLTSKTWLALLGGLIVLGALSLLLLAITFTAWPDFLNRKPGFARTTGWLGWPMLLLGLLFYPLCLLHPYYGELLSRLIWLRMFIFWMMTLLAAQGLKLVVWRGSQATALITALLLQTALTRLALYLPDISAYPFAMSWSETSRFYYPALFISKKIFGADFSWPILHPSLHLLLTPPYMLGAPLWFHRFWQVGLRIVLLGLIAPALLSRFKIESRTADMRWLAGLWICIYLLTLPLYLHLAVPVLIMLWGFSFRDEHRARMWVCLVLASIWAGLSRLNWYPLPGMLAVALYVLETPVGKKGWRYLLKPGLWFLASTGLAFLSMQIYIRLSGVANPVDFYTSLSSAKLWFRLWPNESYWLGVLPGILIFSLPVWLGLGLAVRQRNQEWHILRIGLLLAELLALFVGGLLVSLKIGGGADIHNMDAYAVLLLVIFVVVIFDGGRVAPENVIDRANQTGAVPQAPWGNTALLTLLALIPAWFAVQDTAGFWQYDPAKAQATLTALQQRVDSVNAQGGELLFITQRQLISMHMLNNVKLIPEYEREELMEMAMAQNEAYLQVFRADLEAHRFAAIIVDPLRFNFAGEQDAMGAENNAWSRYVVKRILCNYKQDAIFPADRIVIYVPQVGAQQCP